MEILLWIVLGAAAGWIASAIMKSGNSLGMDVILGIVGSLVGGLVMSIFRAPGVTGFNIYSLIVAVVGSMVLIWLGRMLRLAS